MFYTPETENMPFHFRLIGKDKYVLFSFIQSINTAFGMSIWEQVAEILARDKGYKVRRQVDVVNGELRGCKEQGEGKRFIYKKMRDFIDDYLTKLEKKEIEAYKDYEISMLKKRASGEKIEVPKDCADLYLEIDGKEFFIDITTSKPNLKEFKALKRKILTWQAIRLTGDIERTPLGIVAIPYNPYHPEPYNRWTLKGLYDIENGEILIAEEFWDFVAGEKDTDFKNPTTLKYRQWQT
ncbi:MAG: TdeIII family type II restriction endonuclease [candidate division WOR-3 bacterium]